MFEMGEKKRENTVAQTLNYLHCFTAFRIPGATKTVLLRVT